MPKKYCCKDCFGDPFLTRDIIPKVIADGTGQSRQGDCGYCGAQSTITIAPSALSQWFAMLVDCYDTDDEGRSLAALLKEDWRLFDNTKMDEAHAKELLAEILDDGEIVRRSFAPIHLQVKETPQQWDDLRDEMMHRNRWFLDKPIDRERLAEMLALLVMPVDAFEEITDLWYRARLIEDDKPLPSDEMGAPPRKLAGHGRANPAGIPYLYLGSTRTTAVSEVRPQIGEHACVASFDVRSIRAVDLRDPRKSASPFVLSSAEQIMSLRSGLPLLERLGEELTKPVHPRSAAFEYIPSQYLCEFIKKRGYDGVIYRSSVSDGVNLALFCPNLASAKVATEVFGVDRVKVVISGAQST